jgi:hypothetical protein
VKAIDVALCLGWTPGKMTMVEKGYRKVDEATIQKIKQVISQLAQWQEIKPVPKS